MAAKSWRNPRKRGIRTIDRSAHILITGLSSAGQQKKHIYLPGSYPISRTNEPVVAPIQRNNETSHPPDEGAKVRKNKDILKGKAPGDIEVASSPADTEFRKAMIALIQNARRRITIITGEFYLYEKFLDVRWAVDEALERGVELNIFLKGPHDIVRNSLVKRGAKVFISPDTALEDHYMSVDNKAYMISIAHPPFGIGVRTARLNQNGPQSAKEIVRRFGRLTKGLNPVKIKREGRSPMQRFYETPAELGYRTDASRIDEELA